MGREIENVRESDRKTKESEEIGKEREEVGARTVGEDTGGVVEARE